MVHTNLVLLFTGKTINPDSGSSSLSKLDIMDSNVSDLIAVLNVNNHCSKAFTTYSMLCWVSRLTSVAQRITA
jgi:hypothetical protein